MTSASGCVGRSDFSSDTSSGAALFPTTSTTMPASNSYTKDSQMVEVGGTITGDEAELARMGYKQELKYVQFSLSIHPRLLKLWHSVTTRRDLTLLQVR